MAFARQGALWPVGYYGGGLIQYQHGVLVVPYWARYFRFGLEGRAETLAE